MANAVEVDRWQQLRHTPLRDLVRGRLSGRLDWRGRVQRASLPATAANLVERVVQQTRLWRLEKGEVADELAAHFRDGLASGSTPQALVDSFGDPRVAARLIRRGKIRNRPLAWHAARWSARAFAAAVLLYAGLSLYFLAGRPSAAVDYVAVLNRPIEQTAPSQRAWPVYRSAMVAIHAAYSRLDPDRPNAGDESVLVPGIQPQLAQLRQAAAMPSLGFVLGPGGSQNDPVLFPHPPHSVEAFWRGVSGIMLSYLNELRFGANLLADDANAAAARHDSARFYADWMAIHLMARQIQASSAFPVSGSVAVSMDALAEQALSRCLADQPNTLSDTTLITIAHTLAPPRVVADLVHFEGEQIFIDDAVQRMYTDNGHGDGRMTLPGLRWLWSVNTGRNWPPDAAQQLWEKVVLTPISPALATVMASRRELTEKAKQIIAAYRQAAAQPLRQVDLPATTRDFDQLSASPFNLVRYGPLVTLMWTFYSTAADTERYLGQRDGLEVAIALTLYHRAHGTYPAALDELTPQLLPSVPADRITGEPLKYLLRNGTPIVYSVGEDRVDDGGHYAVDGRGQPMDWIQTAQWGPAVDPHVKGDWILFPPAPLLATHPATQQ